MNSNETPSKNLLLPGLRPSLEEHRKGGNKNLFTTRPFKIFNRFVYASLHVLPPLCRLSPLFKKRSGKGNYQKGKLKCIHFIITGLDLDFFTSRHISLKNKNIQLYAKRGLLQLFIIVKYYIQRSIKENAIPAIFWA